MSERLGLHVSDLLMDCAIIDAYEARAALPRAAIAGLSRAELLAFPVPNTWSIQQIIVHLLESDLAATHRMRRIAAEHRPLIIAYDESALARTLGYEHEDLGTVCDLFELNRRFTAAGLRRLPDEAFDRCGIHNMSGEISLSRMIQMYVDHVDNHLKFVREKRALLGKPMR